MLRRAVDALPSACEHQRNALKKIDCCERLTVNLYRCIFAPSTSMLIARTDIGGWPIETNRRREIVKQQITNPSGDIVPLGAWCPLFCFVKKEITMLFVIVACIVSGYAISRPVVRTLGL